MPYSTVYYSSHSRYGSRNPCPDDMSVSTALIETAVYDYLSDSVTLKNMTYLICEVNTDNSDNLGLILGLSLGLGIPFILIILLACIRGGCISVNCRWRNNDNRHQQIGHAPLLTGNTAFDILSPESQRVYSLGILSESLQTEIAKLSIDTMWKLLAVAENDRKTAIATYIRNTITIKQNEIDTFIKNISTISNDGTGAAGSTISIDNSMNSTVNYIV
jgi:hypothetical protein